MVAGVHEEGSLEFRPGGCPRRAPRSGRRLRHVFQLLERQNLHGCAGRLGLHVHRLTGPPAPRPWAPAPGQTHRPPLAAGRPNIEATTAVRSRAVPGAWTPAMALTPFWSHPASF